MSSESWRNPIRPWPLALGLLAGLAAGLALALGDAELRAATGLRPALAAGVAATMAFWWLTEALPIHWTACVPLLAFPALSILGPGLAVNLRGTAMAYLDPYLFLFAGGMGIAAAMQRWDLHRRIALTVMRAIGTDPRHLLAGTLCATAFVSLWISNTATAAMMLPIALALVVQLESQVGGRRLASFGMALMLAVAYGSNIGGIGTKIGTAPNLQLAGFLGRMGTEVGFLQFLAIGLPFVVMLLPIAWWMLWRIGRRDELGQVGAREVIARELAELGPMARPERLVLVVFALAAAGWIASKQLTEIFAPRLSALFGGAKIGSAHLEGGIAMLAALALVLLRHRSEPVLSRRALATVPWESLLLLGGGFALAAGVQQSGLSGWLGGQLRIVSTMPPFSQVLLASLMTVALSAVASNTATVAVMLVVLRDAAAPAILPTVLFASTIAASCDFALPAGTPPNAIVFGSGYVRIPVMARTGVLLDLVAALLAAVWCYFAVPAVLGF